MQRITRTNRAFIAFLALGGGLLGFAAVQEGDFKWNVHDPARPMPTVVTPGMPGTPTTPGTAPSDAIVLLSKEAGLKAWKSGGDVDCKWTLHPNGTAEVKAGTGDIRTRANFRDVHVHVEWMIPEGRNCRGQGGCNSGVFLMDQYEVQILGTHNNESYADGMAASLYAQFPPLANPCRPNGEWNVYDILFRAPVFAEDGTVKSPAYVTVFFNDIVVQNNVAMTGTTSHMRRAQYAKHADAMPIRLQDHGDPIHFANIWARELPPQQVAE